MKRVKKLVALLLAVTLLAAIPTVAYAASGYVPTKATYYYLENGKWNKDSERTLSYNSSGKIKKVTYKYSDGYSGWTKYSWKGNFVTKISYKDGGYNSFKYKGSKRKSAVFNTGSKETRSYKWKKNKCTYKNGDTTVTLKINGKGQLVSEKYKNADGSGSTTYKYYSNGNLKSYTSKGSGYSYTIKYNSKGFVKSEKGKGTGYSYSYTYSYKTKKGKIKERICKYNGKVSSKTVYSKWKKVSNIRNCDRFGYMVALG
ncbi:MAG: hypothetical protein IJ820_00295 [Lachnospiraceae bacterium]|nr:hypothetical protein [Lachnospiraceae bacterium]